MEISQYSVYSINLDPATGSEIAKVRPCVVISPNEMNKYLRTVIIAPVTHTLKKYPSRVNCKVDGQAGSVVFDQIRTVDKSRISGCLGKLKSEEITELKSIINEMLC